MSSDKHQSTREKYRIHKVKARNLHEESEYELKKELKSDSESSWMLPSLDAQLASSDNESKSKGKKHKKKKSSKKKKKKKSRKSSDSDDDSSEDEWVEKNSDQDKASEKREVGKPAEVVAEVRDEWMSLSGLFPSVTKERKQPKKRDDTEQTILNTMGQSKYELNPYWKSGGTGLPTKEKPTPPATVGTVGDLGADWLRRALTCAKEQAKDEGRSLEDVAAERWGSLAKLESMLAEAEAKSTNRNKPQQRPSKEEYRNHRDDRQGYNTNYQRNRNRIDDHQEDSRDKDRRRDEERGRGNDEDRSRTFRRPDEEERGSSDRFRKPTEDGDERRRDGSRADWRPRNDEDNDRGTSSRFRKPAEEDKGRRDKERSGDLELTRMFQKPRNEDDDGRDSSSRNRRQNDDDRPKDYRRSESHRLTGRHESGWRRKEFVESRRESPTPDVTDRTEGKTPHAQESRKESPAKRDEPSTSGSTLKEAPSKRAAPDDSDDSDSEEPMETSEPAVKVAAALTDKELNDLGAKLVKAEIMGNESLAAELKQKLDAARAVRSTAPPPSRPADTEEVVILTRTDARGMVRPISAAVDAYGGGRKKKGKVETHDKEGKRVRYFPDDDDRSLKEMFESEKLNTVEDSNKMFSEMASKIKPNDDMADIFEDHACREESASKRDARERGLAISETRRNERVLDSCNMCLDSKRMMKHLVIAIGTKVYLSLPSQQSLTEGHCYIVPLHHSICATQLDEDVWTEVQNFRRALTKMFVKMDMDCVFVETAMALRKFPHMWLECIPMPTETGHLAPIYFKKAILECEMEWSTNRKLVDTSQRDVRRAIPKGLPYFSVDFGNQGGFAHVIEEESAFPRNFAQEIVGGMMDLDHRLWRKPQRESFDAQRKKVLQFAQWWKPHDITAANTNRSDSDSS